MICNKTFHRARPIKYLVICTVTQLLPMSLFVRIGNAVVNEKVPRLFVARDIGDIRARVLGT